MVVFIVIRKEVLNREDATLTKSRMAVLKVVQYARFQFGQHNVEILRRLDLGKKAK